MVGKLCSDLLLDVIANSEGQEKNLLRRPLPSQMITCIEEVIPIAAKGKAYLPAWLAYSMAFLAATRCLCISNTRGRG